ncbi:MAG: type II toxin-antitoxin system RelE/ParE family toxin [Nanoarchaeota archaeon]
MVEISFSEKFRDKFSKIKDKPTKEKIIKQIEKIKGNPEIGKPMKYARKGTRELYISPFRLSYSYSPYKEEVVILDLYHKDKQ